MSYGHGISVSLLQLARAYSVFATDGELKPLTLVSRDQPVEGKRVISAATAQAVRKMLEMVTQPGGTATRAQVAGFRVAGKTGTAHKLEGAALRGRSLYLLVRRFCAGLQSAPGHRGHDRRTRRQVTTTAGKLPHRYSAP